MRVFFVSFADQGAQGVATIENDAVSAISVDNLDY
jgi:hypothetical protein